MNIVTPKSVNTWGRTTKWINYKHNWVVNWIIITWIFRLVIEISIWGLTWPMLLLLLLRRQQIVNLQYPQSQRHKRQSCLDKLQQRIHSRKIYHFDRHQLHHHRQELHRLHCHHKDVIPMTHLQNVHHRIDEFLCFYTISLFKFFCSL